MTQEISLDGGFDTIVHQGGSTVELHAGGDITVRVAGARLEVHADGGVEAFTQEAVKVHPAANDSAPAKAALKPGDKLADGTILAGVSPDTGKPMFTTPADAPLTYTFNQAQKYAAELDAHGHRDWRAPTKGELNVLWENRDKGALKGTFNVTGSTPAGWYWSSTQSGLSYAWAQRFSDGSQGYGLKNVYSSLRCVR